MICKRCQKDVHGIHTCSLPQDNNQALIALIEVWLDGDDKPLPSFIEDLATLIQEAGFRRGENTLK